MSVRTCADCTTQYAPDLSACPHCGSGSYLTDGTPVTRLPLFLSLSCTECGRGPWTVRLSSVTTGLIEIPTLACASCGSRVPVTWPPKEEDMPKNHVGRAPTNARDTDDSPAVDASEARVVAEDDPGRPTLDDVQDETPSEVSDTADETGDEPEGDPYAGLTLAELRAEADGRGVPSYGTKAQITERLREDDASPQPEPSAE